MTVSNKVWRRCWRIAWQIETRIYFAALRLLRRFSAPQQDGAPSSDKRIYLTFDDGPGGNTKRLLEFLERYNIKATFFVTKNVNYLDILPQISAAGHTIGNHTANHNYKLLYAGEASFLDALAEMEEIILAQTGLRPNRMIGSIAFSVPVVGTSKWVLVLLPLTKNKKREAFASLFYWCG